MIHARNGRLPESSALGMVAFCRGRPRPLVRLLACAALGWFAASALARDVAAEEIALLVERTPAPGDHVPLVLRTDGVGEVEVRVFRLRRDATAVVRTALEVPASEAEGWGEPGQTATAYTHLVEPTEVSRHRVRVEQAGTRTLLSVPTREAGVHVAVARYGKATAVLPFLVSRLALVVKRHEGGAAVWAVDRRDGRPWEGVGIRFAPPGRPSTEQRTDFDGVAHFASNAAGEARIEAWVRDTTEGLDAIHRAIGTPSWFALSASGPRVHLMTHQPAYRLGEQVEVRGIVRLEERGQWSLDPAATSASVVCVDPRGRRHAVATAAISARTGTFAASLPLPQDAPTGAWQVHATIGARTYSGPLRVEAYRAPAFEVRVARERDSTTPGAHARFPVVAEWLSGGGVGAGPAAFTVFHAPLDLEPFPPDALTRLFFGNERRAVQPKVVGQGQLTLDESGRATIDWPVPAGLADGWLSVAVDVQGPDGSFVQGRAGLALLTQPLAMAVRTDRRLYGPEDVAQVEVRVQHAGRDDDATLGDVLAGRRGVLATARVDDVGVEHWQDPLVFALDREGRVLLAVPLSGSGRWRFRATLQGGDAEAAPLRATAEAIAAADVPVEAMPSASLSLVVDKERHVPGERARIFISGPRDLQAVWLAVEGAALERSRVVRLVEGSAVATIDVLDGYAPGVALVASAVRGGRALEARSQVRVPSAAPLLDVEVVPQQADVRPGGRNAIAIAVRAADGSPVVGADVALAVVDDALHALFQEPFADLISFFHAPRRNNVGTAFLLDVAGATRAVRPSLADLISRAADVNPLRYEEGARGNGAAGAAPAAPPPAHGSCGSGEGAADLDEPAILFGAEGEEAPAAAAPGEPQKDSRSVAAPAEARRAFSDALYWAPTLTTDAEGKASTPEFAVADDLTRWRATAFAVDETTRVGRGTATFTATLPLEARMHVPRFLRAGDAVLASLLLRERAGRPRTEISGRLWANDVLLGEYEAAQLAANGSTPFATQVEAGSTSGSLSLTFAAEASDATGERDRDAETHVLPVHPLGMARTLGRSVLSRDGRATVALDVPATALAETIVARIVVQPNVAAAIEDALPYLESYPHGCTEQTLSRFLPLVVAVAAAEALGHAGGDRATEEVERLLDAGLTRLEQLVHGDGGFGWWAEDASSVEMTALVAEGLARYKAIRSGSKRVDRLLDSAIAWLAERVGAAHGTYGEGGHATTAAALHALAAVGALPENLLATRAAKVLAAKDASPLEVALLLRAARAVGHETLAKSLAAALLAGAQRDATGDVFWAAGLRSTGEPDAALQVDRWERDPVHATAEAGLALVGLAEAEQEVAGAVRWLLAQREGGVRWGSTRDTAAAVRLLAATLLASPEQAEAGSVRVWLGEKGPFTLPMGWSGRRGAVLAWPADALQPGAHLAARAETNAGSFALALEVACFDGGSIFAPESAGLVIERRYETLDDSGSTATRRPLLESVAAGTRVLVTVVVSSDVERRYVMVEDPHVAGFVPEVGQALLDAPPDAPYVEQDSRDERTFWYLPVLPAGQPVVLQRLLRAVHVGRFAALPPVAEAMYYPQIRAHGLGEWLEVRPTERGLEGGGR